MYNISVCVSLYYTIWSVSYCSGSFLVYIVQCIYWASSISLYYIVMFYKPIDGDLKINYYNDFTINTNFILIIQKCTEFI